MLVKHNGLKTICYVSVISTLCIALIFSQLIMAAAAEKQHATLELSRRDMQSLLGGAVCCDNCEPIDEDYFECYHTQSYPTDPNCEQDRTKCIQNHLVTASCEPGQKDALGCDTDTDYPVTRSLHQELWGNGWCTYSNPKWNVHRVIYYGCDFGELKHCDDHTYIKACNEMGCGCYGDWLDEDYKGLVKKTCATCS